jgi:hypothetical protein
MKIKVNAIYLGAEKKHSKKSGNDYYLAKIMHVEQSETGDSTQIFEFYVAGDNNKLMEEIKLPIMTPCSAILDITNGYNGTEVGLISVAKATK